MEYQVVVDTIIIVIVTFEGDLCIYINKNFPFIKVEAKGVYLANDIVTLRERRTNHVCFGFINYKIETKMPLQKYIVMIKQY